MGRGVRRSWWVVPAVLGTALGVMRHPTPASLTSTLPGVGDPNFNLWVLAWGQHGLSQPARLFDANIFWPQQGVLAYSDSMLPLVPPFALLRALSAGSLPFAMNALDLALAALSLGATYRLCLWLTGRRGPSVVGAVAFTFNAYTAAHGHQLQLQSTGMLALAFLALFRVLDSPRPGRGVALGLATAAVALTSPYHGAAWALSAVTVVGLDLVAGGRRPAAATLAALGSGAAVALALVLPVAVPYLQAGDQTRRPALDGYGLGPADLLTPAPGNRVWGGVLAGVGSEPGEHSLFPGAVAGGLALVGGTVVALGGRRSPAGPPGGSTGTGRPAAGRRRYVILLAGAGAVNLAVAAGPTVLGRPGPFLALHRWVPGFGGLLVTARLAVVALLAVAVLAAAGLAALTTRAGSGARWAAAGLCAALVAVEAFGPVQRAPWVDRADRLAVTRALAAMPRAPVAELPVLTPADGPAWNFVETSRMVASSVDWYPRVNGVSASTPPYFAERASVLNRFPDPEALDLMARLGVRYVLLHRGAERGVPSLAVADVDERLDRLPPTARTLTVGATSIVDLGPGPGPERGRGAGEPAG